MICIDPGHGGKDPGAIVGNWYEAGINLYIAKYVAARMKNVVLTRTDDEYVTFGDRRRTAKKCSALVSIHCNAHASFASGFEVWTSQIYNTDLALNFIRKYKEIFPERRVRGIKHRELSVLTGHTNACLLELGFMTNPEELKFITTHQDELGDFIIKALKG